MRHPTRPPLLFVSLFAVLIAGCGSSGGDSTSSSSPAQLNISIAEQGKSASFTVPKSAPGGLVTIHLSNKGKAPHGVQLIQYTGNHTMADVLKELGSDSDVIPSWAKLDGGIGSVDPGSTGTATVNLDAGNYVLADAAALGGPSSGPPATAGIKFSGGTTGDLPSTSADVTAATDGDDHYKWDISGLKAGKNDITFDSEGDDAIHLILAAPLKGKVPPLSQIQKDLASDGPPPAYVDPTAFQSTAVLDGGVTQTLSLDLKPGKYLFFCPLVDRDGKGKPHDQEGLLSVETVK